MMTRWQNTRTRAQTTPRDLFAQQAVILPMTDLERCSIDHWYPALRRVTIRTTIIPLSKEFIQYLLADSVFVPNAEAEESGSDHDGSDGDDWDEDSTEAATRFPEIEDAIEKAIRAHACFPKLNWSAPTDAAWMLGGSLKCLSVHDVLLLLKSSDRVAHDLCDARRAHAPPRSALGSEGAHGDDGDEPANWVLALRRWCNLRPSNEFRCFCTAHGATLVAACQRDRFSYYPFLEPLRDQMLALLQTFTRRHLSINAGLPRRVVVDAYVDTDEKVHLVDVAPFHEATDPLLFEWAELFAAAAAAEATAPGGTSAVRIVLLPSREPTRPVSTEIQVARGATCGPGSGSDVVCDGAALARCPAELRLVESQQGVAPSASMYYGMPHDLRESSGADLSALLESAKLAAARDGESASSAHPDRCSGGAGDDADDTPTGRPPRVGPGDVEINRSTKDS
jgi:hypothetical protein